MHESVEDSLLFSSTAFNLITLVYARDELLRTYYLAIFLVRKPTQASSLVVLSLLSLDLI